MSAIVKSFNGMELIDRLLKWDCIYDFLELTDCIVLIELFGNQSSNSVIMAYHYNLIVLFLVFAQ